MGRQMNDVSMEINSRIRVGSDIGTIRYIGEVVGRSGVWVGVEWDDSSRGKHNGTFEGVKYFETSEPTAGSMIRPGKIEHLESVREAIANRYMITDDDPMDNDVMKDAQRRFKASIFEFVGAAKIQKKQSQWDCLTEVGIPHSNACFAGDLLPLSNLTTLDLTGSLMWNWRSMANVVKQLPQLKILNLSQNKLTTPSQEEIAEIRPAFLHLSNINLRQCNYKSWSNLIQTARLWPNIESLGLQDNELSEIYPVDPERDGVFQQLKSLDLNQNKFYDFSEIIKLGNIKTLTHLYLMENELTKIQLPDCPPSDRLKIFEKLSYLNIIDNPIRDKCFAFNELDKLPALTHLCHSLIDRERNGFEESFYDTIGLIERLQKLNKMIVTREEKRSAEIDTWKKYSKRWMETRFDNDKQLEFFNECRVYPKLIEKFGNPEELFTVKTESTQITITIKNAHTGEQLVKRFPRKLTVQTLQGLIIKLWKLDYDNQLKLKYLSDDRSVDMDNPSRDLDFYSIQDGDIVMVDW